MRTLDFNAIVRLNSCLFGLREKGEARLSNSSSKKAARIIAQSLSLRALM